MEGLDYLGKKRYGRGTDATLRVVVPLKGDQKEYILALCNEKSVTPTDVLRVAVAEFIQNNPIN